MGGRQDRSTAGRPPSPVSFGDMALFHTLLAINLIFPDSIPLASSGEELHDMHQSMHGTSRRVSSSSSHMNEAAVSSFQGMQGGSFYRGAAAASYPRLSVFLKGMAKRPRIKRYLELRNPAK